MEISEANTAFLSASWAYVFGLAPTGGSPIVGSAAHRTTRAAEQHQDRADDQHDDASRPQDGDAEQQAQEEEYESENDHAREVPPRAQRQTNRVDLN